MKAGPAVYSARDSSRKGPQTSDDRSFVELRNRNRWAAQLFRDALVALSVTSEQTGGSYYDVLDALWVALGRACPPAGLAACAGCKKASNRILARTRRPLFLNKRRSARSAGIASCSLGRQSAYSTFLCFQAFFEDVSRVSFRRHWRHRR